MSADRQFRIKISTEADTSGAKEAAAHLGILGGKTKGLEISAGETKKAIRELGREFPELGYLLKVLTSPVGGSITLGILAFTKFKEAIEEMNKASDELMASNAIPTWLAGIEAHRAALNESANAFELWLHKLHQGNDATATFERGLAAANDLLTKITSAKTGVADAMFGLDSAKLKAMFDNNLVTYEEYQNRLTALTIQHNNRMLAIQQEAERAKHQADIDAAKRAAELEQRLMADAKTKVTAAAQEEAKLNKATQDYGETRKAQPGLDAASSRAEENWNAARKKYSKMTGISDETELIAFMRSHGFGAGASLFDEKNQAAIIADLNRRQTMRAMGIMESGAAGMARADAGVAQGRIDRLNASLDKLTDSLEAFHRDRATDQSGRVNRMANETAIWNNPALAQKLIDGTASIPSIIRKMEEFSDGLNGMRKRVDGLRP